MSKGLTQRQEECLEFIICFIEANCSCPSLREIGFYMGIASNRGVQVHLWALSRKGYINIGDGNRQLQVLKDERGRNVHLRFEVVK